MAMATEHRTLMEMIDSNHAGGAQRFDMHLTVEDDQKFPKIDDGFLD
jgi:hypothetical protein